MVKRYFVDGVLIPVSPASAVTKKMGSNLLHRHRIGLPMIEVGGHLDCTGCGA